MSPDSESLQFIEQVSDVSHIVLVLILVQAD